VADDPEALRALGARDSKVLTALQREALEPAIKRQARAFSLVVLEPAEIDALRAKQSLNEVEGRAFADAAAKAARAAGADFLSILQADAADANAANFRAMVVRALAADAPWLRVGRYAVVHKADARFPAVSAASILAKVERDRRVAAISARIGADVGSGYPADPVTVAFLRGYISANGDLPPFARRSWKTSQRFLKEARPRHRPLDAFSTKGGAK
jgi:ribonuclease HII